MLRVRSLVFGAALGLPLVPAMAAAPFSFVPGDLVVSVEGAGIWGAAPGSGTYTDNQAAPLTLFQFALSGTGSASYSGALVLPQAASGANNPISGEYGSSSEGMIQLSGNGQYLAIAGYDVVASAFNANPTMYGTVSNDPTKPSALAQSSSVPGQGYTTVPRDIALIGANGSVDTSTALTGVFNGNNPRSVFTADGSSFYISGQGLKKDATGGVFYATKGATTATSITGADAGNGAAQDTRDVQVVNGQLTVSVDSKSGSTNRDYVGTLGTAGSPPTTLANGGNGPTMLPGFGTSTGMQTITAGTTNGINMAGQQINLSPEQYFFANSTTLYVADSGIPKNGSATTPLGDGGLQKWTFNGTNWVLDYTLSAGLGLVANTASSGVTGLLGLAGQVSGNTVNLYATSYTIGDTDQGYLYGISDVLSATTKPVGETFATLAAAPDDSTFKGVAFAPIAAAAPEPASWVSMIAGFGVIGGLLRRRRRERVRATRLA